MEWTYKGYKCTLEKQKEEDCVKTLCYIVDPNGNRVFAGVSPYRRFKETINLWIDLGCPVKPFGNWDYDSLIEWAHVNRDHCLDCGDYIEQNETSCYNCYQKMLDNAPDGGIIESRWVNLSEIFGDNV